MTADTLTPNLRLIKVSADGVNWTEKMNNNLMTLDAVLSTFFVATNLRGPWTNSTSYAVGDAVVDVSLAIVYKAAVAHTSASTPTTFLEDRTAHSTYWYTYSSSATARGEWMPETVYHTGDFVVDHLRYAVATQNHVSTANFDTDVASGLWSVLIDLTDVEFEFTSEQVLGWLVDGVGALGSVLTSNGPGESPSWQNPVAAILNVDLIATVEIGFPTPNTLPLVIDGATVADQAKVLLSAEASDINNGPMVYDATAQIFSRHPQYPSNTLITKPFIIYVISGDDNSDTYWALQENACTLGVTANTWAVTDAPEGYEPNMFLRGPTSPTNQPAPAVQGLITPADMPQHRMLMGLTTIPQSLYWIIGSKCGKISHYIRPSDPWVANEAAEFILNNFNTLIIDEPINIDSQLNPTTLNGKTIAFEVRDASYLKPCVIATENASFIDASGAVNLSLIGDCFAEVLDPPGASTKFIQATASFTNLRLGRIFTKGYPFGVWLSTNHLGVDLKEVGVYNYPTEVPFTLIGTGFELAVLGKITNLPLFGTTATNGTVTLKANSSSPIIEDTAVLTADRTTNFNTDNVTRDSEFLYKRTGSGAFNRNLVNGGAGAGTMKALITNTWARIKFDAVSGNFKLLSYGAL